MVEHFNINTACIVGDGPIEWRVGITIHVTAGTCSTVRSTKCVLLVRVSSWTSVAVAHDG